MMIFDEFQDLVSQAGSRYGLVIAVTKRAREIRSGEDALVSYPCDKTVFIQIGNIVTCYIPATFFAVGFNDRN